MKIHLWSDFPVRSLFISKVPKANFKMDKCRKGKVIHKNSNPSKLRKCSTDQFSEGSWYFLNVWRVTDTKAPKRNPFLPRDNIRTQPWALRGKGFPHFHRWVPIESSCLFTPLQYGDPKVDNYFIEEVFWLATLFHLSLHTEPICEFSITSLNFL